MPHWLATLVPFALLAAGCTASEKVTDDTGGPDDTAAAAVDADRDGSPADEDCDDDDSRTYPGAPETCDGVDNDCDGETDEGATDARTVYADADGDGYGDAGVAETACGEGDGWVTDATDCDDERDATHPGADEICDEADNDCDGDIDEDATDAVEYHTDSDGDGYGHPTSTEVACAASSGLVEDGTDCDDADGDRHPDADELCDGEDNDCDGDIDEDGTDGPTWYADGDDDGYGTEDDTTSACEAPSGYVEDGADCDDTDDAIHPGAGETCGDEIDNDCDGEIDGDYELDFSSDPSGAMSLNGTAYWDDAAEVLVLTPADAYQAGSAFFTTLMAGDSFTVQFDVEIGGGTGADGMTFAFLDETDPTVVGETGGSLGFFGLTGYGVEFDTYNNSDHDPSSNHMAVVNSADIFGDYEQTTDIPTLSDAGPFTVRVEFVAGLIDVYLDDELVLSTEIDGYDLDEVLMGFSAGTGALTNQHTVDNVVMGCF